MTVRACFYGNDADAVLATRDATGKLSNCPDAATVTLTVTSEPLGVSIGTNELIIVNELTYVKKFVVSVVDAAGVAKAGRQSGGVGGSAAVSQGVLSIPFGRLVDEDLGHVECRNGDLRKRRHQSKRRLRSRRKHERGYSLSTVVQHRLDPGKSDVSVTLLQTKTRADGTAELQLQYAKSFGRLGRCQDHGSGLGRLGHRGPCDVSAWRRYPADAASIEDQDVTPAYGVSPYGVSGELQPAPIECHCAVSLIGMPGGGKSTVGQATFKGARSCLRRRRTIDNPKSWSVARSRACSSAKANRDSAMSSGRLLASLLGRAQGRGDIATGGGSVLRDVNRRCALREADRDLPARLRKNCFGVCATTGKRPLAASA